VYLGALEGPGKGLTTRKLIEESNEINKRMKRKNL